MDAERRAELREWCERPLPGEELLTKQEIRDLLGAWEPFNSCPKCGASCVCADRPDTPEEMERLRTRLAECEAALRVAAPWSCPSCGDHVRVDEDGCCVGCGRDATRAALPPEGERDG